MLVGGGRKSAEADFPNFSSEHTLIMKAGFWRNLIPESVTANQRAPCFGCSDIVRQQHRRISSHLQQQQHGHPYQQETQGMSINLMEALVGWSVWVVL